MFPEMTVLENLQLGAYRRRHENISATIDEMMTLFPRLRERSSQLAGTLSGGEQEMVAIARALMAKPRLCIFDEPSLGLAPKVVDEIEETLLKIKGLGVTILLVEQAVSMALRVADRAYVLEAGEVVTSGASEEIRSSPLAGARPFRARVNAFRANFHVGATACQPRNRRVDHRVERGTFGFRGPTTRSPRWYLRRSAVRRALGLADGRRSAGRSPRRHHALGEGEEGGPPLRSRTGR